MAATSKKKGNDILALLRKDGALYRRDIIEAGLLLVMENETYYEAFKEKCSERIRSMEKLLSRIDVLNQRLVSQSRKADFLYKKHNAAVRRLDIAVARIERLRQMNKQKSKN